MAFEEKTLSSEIVYEGPIFTIRKHEVECVNGKTSYRDVLEHSGGSVMLGVKDDGHILMVKQYRKPLERMVLELPAGKIDPNEEPIAAAGRELREETGYTPAEVKHMVTYTPTCGYSAEKLHIYLCTGLTEGETDFDETEDLDTYEYTADELIEMILKGEIEDGKTIIGILFARQAGLI